MIINQSWCLQFGACLISGALYVVEGDIRTIRSNLGTCVGLYMYYIRVCTSGVYTCVCVCPCGGRTKKEIKKKKDRQRKRVEEKRLGIRNEMPLGGGLLSL